MNWRLWILPIAIWLTACATAPNVQVVQTCPEVPMLELDLPEDALERSFTERMQQWLSGSLEMPTSYDLHSEPVKLPTIK